MADFLQGFLGTYQSGVEARNDVTVAIRNWFANRNPLVTRLPYVPVERVDFLMYTHKYRARSTTLGAAVTSTSQTAITTADATFLMNHDVLQFVDSVTGNTEYVQINGDPTSSTTFNVNRGVARHHGACERGEQLDRKPDRQLAEMVPRSTKRASPRSAFRGRSIARRSSSRCRLAARHRRPGHRSCRAVSKRPSISI